MKKEKTKLEEKVMNIIKKKEIKMKPKAWFVAKEWGLRIFVGIAMLGIGLLLLTIGYVLEKNSAWELLDFGDLGRGVFLGEFPYLFLVGAILLLGVSVAGLNRVGQNYKKTKLVLLGMVVGATMIISVLLLGIKWRIGV